MDYPPDCPECRIPPDCPECQALDDQGVSFGMHSGVAVNEGRTKPFVHITCTVERGQITPEETRRLALDMLEVAESADTDCYITAWLTDKVGARSGIGQLLLDFRKQREEMNGRRSTKSTFVVIDSK